MRVRLTDAGELSSLVIVFVPYPPVERRLQSDELSDIEPTSNICLIADHLHIPARKLVFGVWKNKDWIHIFTNIQLA